MNWSFNNMCVLVDSLAECLNVEQEEQLTFPFALSSTSIRIILTIKGACSSTRSMFSINLAKELCLLAASWIWKPKGAVHIHVLTTVMISFMVKLNIAISLPSSSNFLCQVLSGGWAQSMCECAWSKSEQPYQTNLLAENNLDFFWKNQGYLRRYPKNNLSKKKIGDVKNLDLDLRVSLEHTIMHQINEPK